MPTLGELKRLYDKGVNISEWLRRESGVDQNTDEIIALSYELQAGSYVRLMQDADHADLRSRYSAEIARRISDVCQPLSILEAGVGEATTLSGVLGSMPGVPAFGFDASWSRIKIARNWIMHQGLLEQVQLCTGSLFATPFEDSSIDVVYTSHSIEPNGGREREALRELYRIAGRLLVLVEPSFELANAEAKERMSFHGYCKDLPGIAQSLGYEVECHERFPVCSNPMNPTAITIIRKHQQVEPTPKFACPRSRTGLRLVHGFLFSPESLCAYPVLDGIPCLRPDSAVLAARLEDDS